MKDNWLSALVSLIGVGALLAGACSVADRKLDFDTSIGPLCSDRGDDCDECLAKNCAKECSACTSSIDCVGLFDCWGACESDDSDCLTSCATRYPALSPLSNALTCVTKTCASTCTSTGKDAGATTPGNDGGTMPVKDAGGPAPTTLSASISAFATVVCSKMKVCAPGDLSNSFGTEAECVARTASHNTKLASFAGVNYSVAMFEKCNAVWSARTCNDYAGPTPPECEPPGSRANGSACTVALQCQSLYCKGANFACGTCAAKPNVGDSCTGGIDCPLGTSCTGGACQKLREAGESCSATLPCTPLLGCYNGVCTPALTTTGAACDQEGGLRCSNGKNVACDSTTNRCVPIVWRTIGQTCNDMATQWNRCSARGVCVAGKCTAGPNDGGACDLEASKYCEWPAGCTSAKVCMKQTDLSCL
ncbi:MAG TPA: hypothetical protein VJT73_21815 [Polyangiaceae bacterium]|nr:hypothetical protein [Polyangiaceae bacterium]